MKTLKLLLALVLSAPFGVLQRPGHVAAVPSQNVVIAQVQTGGAASGTATQELVLLYNTTDADINVTGWCVDYSSASNGESFSKATCIAAQDDAVELWLEAGGFVSFATDTFVEAHEGFVADFSMSGGFAASGGHVRFVDSAGAEVDRVGWGGAVASEGASAVVHDSGEVLGRDMSASSLDTDDNAADFSSQPIMSVIISGLYEAAVVVDVCPNIDEVQAVIPVGYLHDEQGDCVQDVCLNIDGLQVELPAEMVLSDDGYECLEVVVAQLENRALIITELYPNAPSFDTGQEFIELFNPHAEAIELEGYTLLLGPALTKSFVFSSGQILSNEYIVMSDADSGIVLPNSSAYVMLVAPSGDEVSKTGSYDSPGDDTSWSLVGDTWEFTSQVTPGAENKASVTDSSADEAHTDSAETETTSTTSLVPCSAGQFRNPATNRCKAIETAVSELAPCKEGQFRNPETNRCKNSEVSEPSLGSSSTGVAGDDGLVPCQEGQFRNPETNRCKKIVVDDQEVSSLVPCAENQFRNPETNRCKLIGSAVSQLAPCGAGQERNPDTNRCRSVATTTASSLIPCNEGQFRNPETNRCKSITAASSDLVPCGEGQERNPETNRCRKAQGVLGSSTDSAFPAVTDVAVEATSGSLNWLLIGGLVTAVGGYFVYEWRTEAFRKLKWVKARLHKN